MRAQLDSRAVDALISTLASRQHGVVGRGQLLEAGVGRGAIGHRVATGRLQIVHRSVYSVGHRSLSPDGRWMAAVLAAGPEAVASHRCGAAVWRLLDWDRLEVTVPRARIVEGLLVHRFHLPADEVTRVRGIPVTTAARTLLDLAAVAPIQQVERAMSEAEYRRLTTVASVSRMAERYPRRRGIATVKAILRAFNGGITRSELEGRFARFLRKAGLPLPRLNVNLVIEGRWLQADCAWHEQRLIVELDGHGAHWTAAAFERDRERDRVLAANGWRVVRVTWRQLHREPRSLAADLARILA